MQEKGVFTEVHWLQTTKLLNKTENSEKNPQSEGKFNPPWPSHLLHSELSMQRPTALGKCDAYRLPWRQGEMVAVRDFEWDFTHSLQSSLGF